MTQMKYEEIKKIRDEEKKKKQEAAANKKSVRWYEEAQT